MGYLVKFDDGKGNIEYVGSPTNTRTEVPTLAACFDKKEAENTLKYWMHGPGTFMGKAEDNPFFNPNVSMVSSTKEVQAFMKTRKTNDFENKIMVMTVTG